jgi:hypothetical protein
VSFCCWFLRRVYFADQVNTEDRQDENGGQEKKWIWFKEFLVFDCVLSIGYYWLKCSSLTRLMIELHIEVRWCDDGYGNVLRTDKMCKWFWRIDGKYLWDFIVW